MVHRRKRQAGRQNQDADGGFRERACPERGKSVGDGDQDEHRKAGTTKRIRFLDSRETGENEIEILPIRLAHLSEMMKLPFHHRDPFDRLIIAQSITEDLPLITHDGIFKKYPVEIFSDS